MLIQSLCKETGLVAKILEPHFLFPYNEAGIHYTEDKKGCLLILKEEIFFWNLKVIGISSD